MTPSHLSTFENLRTIWQSTVRPELVIRGQLANDLLAAGLFRVVDNGECLQGVLTVSKLQNGSGPMAQVYDLLREIDFVAKFEIARRENGFEIRILPKIRMRREGN